MTFNHNFWTKFLLFLENFFPNSVFRRNNEQSFRRNNSTAQVLQEARERKQAFQRKVEAEWQARQQSKKAAAESGYYNLEWV